LTKKKPVSYSEIKFGDTIRVTRTYNKGTVEILEGAVYHVTSQSLYTEDNICLLTYDPIGYKPHTLSVDIELLNRPKMPYKVGTVISASLKNGTGGNFVRIEKASDDDELLWLELGGVGDNYITEDAIKEWQELKLVSVDAKVSYE
jgi:hypothetical protein